MTKFDIKEREILKTAKFVGDKVIDRFEEIGIYTCVALSQKTVDEICTLVAAHLGASCWKNSPQSKAAVANAINTANEYLKTKG
ncbi:helix-hairpin-helix domain-containing protein [Pseudaquidulcibacter saccharophilus]|uniref:helix-hairpin-helix domain-containing protein n=1 Tax=Pseudaquidulcibacter saccharophilus TaxID=2831900 RepID=UPI001EFF33E3|nr:helix-hairpin-helix domain-containing protein [Pseudaquidulcibacter saccharophilus]